jgi:hypothetical protein
MDHLKKNADDLNHGNFDADGVCINPDISRGGKPSNRSRGSSKFINYFTSL